MSSKKTKTQISFADNILSAFGKEPFRPLNYKQLSASLGIKDKANRVMIQKVIQKLTEKKILEEVKPGKFRLAPNKIEKYTERQKYTNGRIEMLSTRKAYLNREKGEDVFIAAGNTGTALNGDIVKVLLFPRRSKHKPEGKVIEIIKRSNKQYVGVVDKLENFTFVIPDANSMPIDIFIPPNDLNGAQHGDKVMVEISDWDIKSRNPWGKVVMVLGKPGDNDVEMSSILLEYNFALAFPLSVEKAAQNISDEISDSEISHRRDCRSVWTITIDPEDAKDFDDAISLQKLDNGHWEVGVHIADVTHYVKSDSVLDIEAAARATSVYLVDRVIPMLPERLSNEICSLRPGEDKLTFSAIFEMDDKAKIYSQWFGKTIIHSDRRYAYEEVQQMIEGANGDYKTNIMTLHHLSSSLRQQRMKNGAINFDSREIKFHLDDDKQIKSVYIKEQKEANWLIEDFMLLANRKVAEFIGKKTIANQPARTFIYRIHHSPNPEKLNDFASFVSRLGYKIDIQNRQKLTSSFNKLFAQIEGKGEKNMIETIALRTMAKAIYSTHNIGHYGLAFDYYTHFTSPIRRYPDMMVHRLLERYLSGGNSMPEAPLEAQCEHSSDMERRAQEAERASVKYKQAEFLKDKIGQVFAGKVSGISKWGIFVEISENYCEGMVRISDMADDYYYIDEENYRIVGYHSKKIICLGDPIKIKIKNVDLRKREIDFLTV